MRSTTYITVCCVLLASIVSAQPCADDGLVADRAVVRVAVGRSISEAISAFEAAIPDASASVANAIESRGIYQLAIELPVGTSPESLELSVFSSSDPSSLLGDGTDPLRPLIWGELDYEVETGESKTGSGYVSGPALTLANADTQYGTAAIGLSGARSRASGAGVAVAILDTGLEPNHPLLANAIVGAGYNFVRDSFVTRDLPDGLDNDGDGDIDEGVGHGTFVAGLIHQVAPDARLLPVVVLDSEGRAGTFRIAQGLFFAIDQGVEVVNMSLGTTYDSTAMEDALDEAKALGISLVGAAGNCNSDTRVFPAMKSGVIGVASLDSNDRKSSFSNFNDRVTIAAPGGSVADAGDPTGYDPTQSILGALPDGSLGVWEGTSLATAWVSGGVALLRAQHPEWPSAEITSDRIEDLLMDYAIDVYDVNPAYAEDEELGAGLLDLAAATAAGPQQQLGDLNGDQVLDLSDLTILLNNFGETHSSADLDADGMVGIADLAVLLTAFQPCPGDVNGDRMVDLQDLAVVLSSFGEPQADRSSGDLDSDGDVDLTDLAIVLQHFGSNC